MKNSSFKRMGGGIATLIISAMLVLASCSNVVVWLPPANTDAKTYDVNSLGSLADAARNAADGDTININNVSVNPAWRELPLLLNDGVTVTGSVDVSSSAPATAALMAASAAPKASESAISIFSVRDNANVTFTDLEITIDTGAKELVSAVISVDRGVANVSNVTVSETTVPVVELGANSTADSVTGNLSGLTISVDPDNNNAYEIADNIASNTGSTPTVGGETFAVINTTDNTGYKTFAEAFKAASNGSTIKLASDVVCDEQYSMVDKTITLDLNGYEMTVGDTLCASNGLFYIYGGSQLTVNDSSEEKTGGIDVNTDREHVEKPGHPAVWGVFALYPEKTDSRTAKLTINGGTFKAPYYPVVGSGNNKFENNTEITITDGTFICSDDPSLGGLCIYHPQNGTLTISGGTFIGHDTAIEFRAGTLHITGGEFSASGVPQSVTPNGNGTTTVGAAIAIAQHTSMLPIDVDIEGGSFTGYSAIYESNPQKNPEVANTTSLEITGGEFNTSYGGDCVIFSETFEGFITGGTFGIKPDDKYLAEGYTSVNNGSGWEVQEFDGTLVYDENSLERRAITSIGGVTGFDDDSALILSGNVKLMNDITTEHIIYVPKGVTATLDLNGHKIESMFEGYTIGNFGTLTINDSSAVDGEKGTGIVFNSSKVLGSSSMGHDAIRNFGVLTVNGGTFGDSDTDETNANDTTYAAGLRNLGIATINGGYFTCLDNYGHWSDTGESTFSYAVRSEGTLTMNGGKVYGKCNGGISADAGTISINDGEVHIDGATSYYVLVIKAGTDGNFQISGGKFTKEGDTASLIGGFSGMPSWDIDSDREALEEAGYFITGGTFVLNGETVVIPE